MAYFKDNPALAAASLAPAKPVAAPPPSGTILGRMARSYNAVGGLINIVAQIAKIDPVAVLSVWYVESGGAPFVPGQPVLRFEVHKFYKYWGRTHLAEFDAHFQFGGHAGIPGTPSQNHKYRVAADGAWSTFHGDQAKEYDVFALATSLSTKDLACMSASFGGAQIMGFNHGACGYDTAAAMFDAFAADARWQVLGFFDFCQTNAGLLHDIQVEDWVSFGTVYNGDGATYGPHLAEAYGQKTALEALIPA